MYRIPYFSNRFLVFFAFGMLPMVFGIISPAFLHIGYAYDLVLFTLFLADVLLLPALGALSVTRTYPDVLSLGTRQRLVLTLQNPTQTTIRAEIMEALPDSFVSDDNHQRVILRPLSETDVIYHATPYARGDYELKTTYLRITGRLGLAVRRVKYDHASRVKVYPDLSHISRMGFHFRTMQTSEFGARLSKLRGGGTEFESLREYLPHDDYRRIDWKATARNASLITRQYEAERAQRVVLAIDAGRLMTGTVEGYSKLDHAINAAWTLAVLCEGRGDYVGLVVFADKILTYLPPGRGSDHLVTLVNVLYRVQPAFLESDYAGALSYLRKRCPRRSLVVLFTELLDMESSKPLLSHLGAMARRHLPLCITLRNHELEEVIHQCPDARRNAHEKAAAVELQEEKRRALAYLGNRGAMAVECAASELVTTSIDKYLEIKAKGLL
ncbi:DUF58 domain-containing protein [Candidatus Hydrogenedentota bacterium]